MKLRSYSSRVALSVAAASIVLLAGCASVPKDLTESQLAVARQTLPAGDGWGSFGPGTTGGSAAKNKDIRIVTSRKELVDALGGDNAKNALNDTPAIIFVKGTISLTADDSGKEIDPKTWQDPAFNWDAYFKTYDPAVYGNAKRAEGPLEDARKRSQQNMEKHVFINVGSNKTLIGLGNNAKIMNGGLSLKSVKNIIIRNLNIEDASDLFTTWDPRDGTGGNWNAEYDNIRIVEDTQNVWVDHNTMSDGARSDDKEPIVFGKLMLKHDGLMDITNRSSYITVSNNIFRSHGKTNLVGSSDGRKDDDGKLKVTFRHNWWQDTTERMPRVRFGQVDVYNNYYKGNSTHKTYGWSYGVGAGVGSKVYMENNAFEFEWGIQPYQVIKSWKGETLFEKGTTVNGANVNVLAEWNKFAADPKNNVTQLKPDVGWTPTLRAAPVLATKEVKDYVMKNAGAGKLQGL